MPFTNIRIDWPRTPYEDSKLRCGTYLVSNLLWRPIQKRKDLFGSLRQRRMPTVFDGYGYHALVTVVEDELYYYSSRYINRATRKRLGYDRKQKGLNVDIATSIAAKCFSLVTLFPLFLVTNLEVLGRLSLGNALAWRTFKASFWSLGDMLNSNILFILCRCHTVKIVDFFVERYEASVIDLWKTVAPAKLKEGKKARFAGQTTRLYLKNSSATALAQVLQAPVKFAEQHGPLTRKLSGLKSNVKSAFGFTLVNTVITEWVKHTNVHRKIISKIYPNFYRSSPRERKLTRQLQTNPNCVTLAV